MNKPLNQMAAYALAVASVALVVVLGRFVLWDWLDWTSALFFLLTIALSTWYGGTRPGLFCTILSILAINYFYLAPYFALSFTRDNSVWLPGYTAAALLLVWILSSHRRIERDLREQSRFFRITLASIGDAVVTTDRDGRITFVNPVAEALTGWSQEEARGRSIPEVLRLVNEQTGEQAMDPVQEVLRRGTVLGLANHTALISRDGMERPIEDSAAPIRDDDGNLFGVVLVFHDVSERRKAERAIQDSEEQLRFALKAARMGIWDWDIQSGGLSWSDDLVRLHGFEEGGFPGTLEAFQDRVHPDDREAVRQSIARTVEQGEPYDAEFRIVWPDGSIHWMAGKGQVRRDPSGTPIRLIGVGLDVTERRRTEEALRESEARFRHMANTAPLLIWQSGIDRLCTWFNQQWLEFTGRTLEQELGNGWTESVHPDDLETCLRTYEGSFDARQSFRMEYRLRRHDGQYRWVLDEGSPVFGSEGTFNGYIGGCVDIDDRIEAEYQLRALNETLEQRVAERTSALEDRAAELARSREALHQEASNVRLLQAVAVAANEATSIEEALATCLEAVCRHTGWPLGHAFLIEEGAELVSSGMWCGDGSELWNQFKQATAAVHLTAGTGFPGIVCATRKPAWVMNADLHPGFMRSAAAREAGIRCGFAFPVLVGRSVGAVLEFFSRENLPPDEGLLEVMAHVGTQIGRVIERKRAEADQARLFAQTEAAEGRFRRLLESAPDGVVITDQRGRIVLINSQTERMFGYGRDELEGKSVDVLVPDRYRAGHGKDMDQYRHRPQVRPMGFGRELYGRRADGSEFPVEISLSPLETPEGLLVMSIVRDVTERRRLEEALRQSERLAAIGQMITGLSHESRNALQRSLACLEMLGRKLDDNQPQARKLLDEARRAQQDLQQVYEEVREYAAPVNLERAPTRLDRIWRTAWENLEPQWAGRQARLVEAVDGMDLGVEVDPFRFQQVFRNLFENALAACADPAEIVVGCAPSRFNDREAFLLSVRDSGPGLDAEGQKRIFEPFYTTKAKGTGLGMAIVKRIVESHGGRIEVNPSPAGGLEVSILIPRSNP